MSIDRLQDKIRKLKNPTVVDLGVLAEHIPAHIMESAGDFLSAYKLFSKELLTGLAKTVPAVRFDFNALALYGAEGLAVLEELLKFASSQGFYVLLDAVQSLSAQDAQRAAGIFMADDCRWRFDGLVLASYIGSDGFQPYVAKLQQKGKDLFIVVRTSNKTAGELQDLMTGARLVYMANADIANRFAQPLITRCGYSQVGMVGAASSADCLRTLRSKYKEMFLLLDGCDYPNANAKNCSFAFDRLGHGAAACAGLSITAAWMEEGDGTDFVEKAIAAAERLKKNLLRYIDVL